MSTGPSYAAACAPPYTITTHIPQRRLEELLGLSRGYISKLRAGDRNPSPELVSDLALIARDPEGRLQELESLWASDDVNRSGA
jgi:transcriptional regulator with XRE-family HTH domain